jgi:outer membrane scaffolding protein for murein synthesis (MipA/OmpV family)
MNHTKLICALPSPTAAAGLLVASALSAGCQSLPGSDGPNLAQRRNLGSAWTASKGEPGWTFDVVAGLESEPDYAGSDDNATEADLFARALYEDSRGHRYFLSLGELGAWWKLGDDWALGTILEFEPGRDNENAALMGFDEVDDTVEGQVTLARRMGDWTVAAVLQPDVLGNGKGFVAFAAAAYDRMLTDSLRLGASADISTGDSEHMSTEFGVNANGSAASGLDRFKPDAGLKSATVDLGLEYFFRPGFSLLGGVSAEYYFSNAADSPLIAEEGSELTIEYLIGLRYSF